MNADSSRALVRAGVLARGGAGGSQLAPCRRSGPIAPIFVPVRSRRWRFDVPPLYFEFDSVGKPRGEAAAGVCMGSRWGGGGRPGAARRSEGRPDIRSRWAHRMAVSLSRLLHGAPKCPVPRMPRRVRCSCRVGLPASRTGQRRSRLVVGSHARKHSDAGSGGRLQGFWSFLVDVVSNAAAARKRPWSRQDAILAFRAQLKTLWTRSGPAARMRAGKRFTIVLPWTRSLRLGGPGLGAPAWAPA